MQKPNQNAHIKSIFEQVAEKLWLIKDLKQAKEFINEFVLEKEINEKDKFTILKATNEAKSLYILQKYIANCLLKYEGLGLNQLEKKATKGMVNTDSVIDPLDPII